MYHETPAHEAHEECHEFMSLGSHDSQVYRAHEEGHEFKSYMNRGL